MQQNGFYCKTYCPLNTFRAPLCSTSGVHELYKWLLPMVHGALVYRSLVWCGAVRYASGLRDVPQTGSITYSSTPDQRPVNQPATRKRNLQRHTRPTTCKPKHHVPQTATICITRELLMMGIMVPETC